MRLVQFIDDDGQRRVAIASQDGQSLQLIREFERTHELALQAAREDASLQEFAGAYSTDETVDYQAVVTEKRLLPPLDHPQPSRCYVTGTGLSHLGSAEARDKMHAKTEEDATTDSMRLFRAGLDGGKPEDGSVSVQPEWFYKGNGHSVVAPEHPLVSPAFALDAGEEAELVGLYVIGDDGQVLRIGFAIGNEFADHVMERQNYLYLAHSKLRACSFGPELRVGIPPLDIRGEVSIHGNNAKPTWKREFLTGEANMSYTFSNLEHHHFKYEIFRRPGDVHCHFFGTATLSFSDGVTISDGDVIQITAGDFGRPLRNPVQICPSRDDRRVAVHTL